MYRMLGADQKEYGPIPAETLRQWIADGRANTNTMVLPDGASQWVPLGSLPEFSAQLGQPGIPQPMMPYPPQPVRTSGMAIASLVLGILGMCTYGLTALVGLILGIVALSAIKKSQGQIGGKGLAIAGISVSGVFLLILPGLLAAIAIPNFVKARTTAQKNACINNLRQMDGAKEQWALENKKLETSVPTWSDLIGTDKYIKVMPACPANGSYTLNSMSKKPTCSVAGHNLDNY